MSTHTTNTNVQKNKRFLKWFLISVGIVVALIIIAGIAGGGSEDTATDDQQTEQQEPAAPLEAIATATDDEAEATLEGINLEVSFPLSTNVTQGMLGATARQNTVDALEAIQQHGDSIDQDWERIIVRGYQDDREIMSPVYLPEDIAEVDFDNFNPVDVWDLRDTGMVHPDLEED